MPGFDLTPPDATQRARLEATLDEAERRVLLAHGTEAPFCGVFLDNKREGVYTCRLCGLPKRGDREEGRKYKADGDRANSFHYVVKLLKLRKVITFILYLSLKPNLLKLLPCIRKKESQW